MSDVQEVRVRNHRSSTFDQIILIWIIFAVMSLAGCEDCKGTNSGLECMGKTAGEIYAEYMLGFTKGILGSPEKK